MFYIIDFQTKVAINISCQSTPQGQHILLQTQQAPQPQPNFTLATQPAQDAQVRRVAPNY